MMKSHRDGEATLKKMPMTYSVRGLGALLLFGTLAIAQQGTTPAAQTPAARADLPNSVTAKQEQEARFARWIQAVPSGSGPYGTMREEFASLPNHTVFRPAKMGDLKGKMPIVAFANGGCRNTPIEFTAFLAELASRGYFIVAAGTDDGEFATTTFAGNSANGQPLQVVTRTYLTTAVDWAIQQNAAGPFKGKIAVDKIAYMGQSCGGMQALSASTDPRTTTTVVLNSGRFPKGMKGPPGATFSEWFEWSELHAPIAFFLGGKSDVQVGHQNFDEINSLPMFLADLPVGHVGAYPGPDMRWVKAVVGWLDWQLKGNKTAEALFLGQRCGLCTDPDWTVTGSKNFK